MKLADIFMSKKMKKEVEKTHESFIQAGADTLMESMFRAQLAKPTSEEDYEELLEVFSNGSKKFTDSSMSLNMVDIAMLDARRDLLHDYIRDMGVSDVMGLLESDEITIYELEDLSIKCWLPSQVMAFKHFVLCNDLEGKYRGFQPQTSPVLRAEKVLFGSENKNPYRHTLLCNTLAEELGTNPTYINTALWVIGRRSE